MRPQCISFVLGHQFNTMRKLILSVIAILVCNFAIAQADSTYILMPSTLCVGGITEIDYVSHGVLVTWPDFWFPLSGMPSGSTGTATLIGGGAGMWALQGTSPGLVWLFAQTNDGPPSNDYQSITILPLPAAPDPVTGNSTICVGSTTTLYDDTAGGSWSASNGNATIDPSTGAVTGVSGGSVTMTYTISNSCGTNYTTFDMSITPAPDAGSISGSPTICLGSVISFSDGVSGGVWLSGNSSVASVESGTGLVTGNSSGLTTIYYSVANSCGSSLASYDVLIMGAPWVAPLSGG